MSDIMGQGHGSKHSWKRGWTPPSKCTPYRCSVCGVTFDHWYDVQPNIYKAMAEQNVPAECATPSAAPSDAPKEKT